MVAGPLLPNVECVEKVPIKMAGSQLPAHLGLKKYSE